jgi:type IV secretion system protein VirD4
VTVRRRDRPVVGRRRVGPVGLGPVVTLPPDHSLLVVGPTQSGKTTGIVVPAALRWPGALVVTSVKRDVVALTAPWRSRVGRVVELAPGEDGGLTFDPLEGVRGHRDAIGVARDLVVGSPTRASAESEFWNALAVKLLGALVAHTVREGGTIYDLVGVVESRRYLDDPPARGEESVLATLRSFALHEPRTADAVATTAEAMLTPWQLRQPLAQVVDLVTGPHTLYLVAPAQEQRRYEGLFRLALHRVLLAQQRHHESGGGGRLLCVLDEAAAVAPLEDLDQLAATGAGIGVTIVSVFQDFAQIEARWGERAPTIVNNHASRLVVAGLCDPRVATYLPELTAAPGVTPPRRWPARTGAFVSGHRAVTSVRLVPFTRVRRLRTRARLVSDPVTLVR